MYKCPACEKELTFVNFLDVSVLEGSSYLYAKDFLNKPELTTKHRIISRVQGCPHCKELISPRDVSESMLGAVNKIVSHDEDPLQVAVETSCKNILSIAKQFFFADISRKTFIERIKTDVEILMNLTQTNKGG